MPRNKVFKEITNDDIYEKLEAIEEKTIAIEKHVIKTNGNVKVNRALSLGSLGICSVIIGIVIKLVIL